MINLCTPALMYFILAVMSILLLIVNKTTIMIVFSNIVWVLLWTWFLNFICRKGFTSISWVLVLAPYVIILLAVATGMVKLSDLQPKVIEKEKETKESLVLL